MKKNIALLVVSFGTSYDETRIKTLDCLDAELEERFEDVEVRNAWTDDEIIHKIKIRDDIRVLNVQEAISDIIRNGYAKAAIQPTQIINDEDFEEMVEHVKKFQDEIKIIGIGEPLLTFSEDYEKVCTAIMDDVGELAEDEALLLMARGNKEHHADSAYAALDYRFKSKGYDNVHVATLEGFPEVAHAISALKKTKVKRVKLMPLMLTVGPLTLESMCGNVASSWASILKREGYEVEYIVKNLGELQGIREIFIDHIDRVLETDRCRLY